MKRATRWARVPRAAPAPAPSLTPVPCHLVRWRKRGVRLARPIRPLPARLEAIGPTADQAALGELVARGAAPAASVTTDLWAYVHRPLSWPSRTGGRFHGLGGGALYLARERETAEAEVRYHASRLLAATAQPAQPRTYDVVQLALEAPCADLRSAPRTWRHLLDPDPARYGPAQAWGTAVRAAGVPGIVYDSARRSGGACAAVFTTAAITRVQLAGQVTLYWDGRRFTARLEPLSS